MPERQLLETSLKSLVVGRIGMLLLALGSPSNWIRACDYKSYLVLTIPCLI
jgi:hypothetical protein